MKFKWKVSIKRCMALTVVMMLASYKVYPSVAPSELQKVQIGGVTFELVRVPAGQFHMGSESGDSDEKPMHGVRIRENFYMGRTEVTVRQFRAFVRATGYKTEAEKGRWAANYAWGFPIVPARDLSWHQPGFTQSEDNPAVCISWNDAVVFCRWLSKETGDHYRLPSEAEWEYACRAGSESGDSIEPDEVGWYCDNSGGATHPVGQKAPNVRGIYDMHGNAWEWCLDVWHCNYKGAPNDGGPWLTEDSLPGVAIRRILRGGAWCRMDFELDSTYRYRGTEDFRSNGSGFRIVRSDAPVNEKAEIKTPAHKYSIEQRNVMSKSDVEVDGVAFKFVRIPAGEFLMGSEQDNCEKPLHPVRIGYSFDIGETEVTVRQFRLCTESTGYQTDAEKERWAWTRTGRRDWDPELTVCWWNLPFEQTDDDPVTCISWHDAMEFCKWLSGKMVTQIRLPSEAEWEYTCRAGTKGRFAGDVDLMAWHRGNSGLRTHPVGQKMPNDWGLYDMHGNVWEWCLDMWHDSYEGAPNDGSAWTQADTFEPVMRGGSFVNPTWWLRSANHMRNNPGNRLSYNQGIRIVRVVESCPALQGGN
ncbi:MAG: SUMF1/EgtB/PvdO family nonheme iron enzyme [Phycisphaerales bacterium]|nr:MAG: SUMF1/EgtB/PvdO family nonheme iron enzyme [Phycisphaerales bacterium]